MTKKYILTDYSNLRENYRMGYDERYDRLKRQDVPRGKMTSAELKIVDRENRDAAEGDALEKQNKNCAVCAKSLRCGALGYSPLGRMRMVASVRYEVHRIKPGRVGGKYTVGNVQLVCGRSCHATLEKESRRLYPATEE